MSTTQPSVFVKSTMVSEVYIGKLFTYINSRCDDRKGLKEFNDQTVNTPF